jgi:hypothetical protein
MQLAQVFVLMLNTPRNKKAPESSRAFYILE